MSLTQVQKDALNVVQDLFLKTDHPMVSAVGLKMVIELRRMHMSPREILEEVGAKLKAEHDHKGPGCTCMERYQFLTDVLAFLEKQSLNDEIISDNLDTAVGAWAEFEEQFERAPTVTYVHSQYVIETGVAGVYFIHPAAQK